MGDYDLYLRHALVRSGEWVGFRLGWRGLGGLEGLPGRPHRRWRPWLLSPGNPDDVAAGSWNAWRWRLDLALLDGLVGLAGMPPADGRTPADMRGDLLAFANLPAVQLRDVDDAVYTAKIVGYQEQSVETYDAAHLAGGWVTQVELVAL